MILRRVKRTVTAFQQRKKRLEREKEKQLAAIEKMYEHAEAKDAVSRGHEKHTNQLNGAFALRFWIIGAFVVYFSYIIFKTLDVVYLILAAFVISMIMDAPISWFAKRMNRGLAIAIAYLLILLVVAVFMFFVMPFVVGQIADALKLLIERINDFQNVLKTNGLEYVIQNKMQLPGIIKKYILEWLHSKVVVSSLQANLQDNISQIISTSSTYATNLGSFAVKLVTSVFSTVLQWVILFFMAIFFSVEKEQVINFVSWLAGHKKNHTYVKLQKMYAKLGLWLKGQAIICLYVGVMILILYSLGSWIFGIQIPNIASLALIAGFTNLVPYIGPFIWMTIATLVVLIAWWWKAGLLALIIYILVNQSENNILTPIVMNKTLGVSPLLVFICMLLGGLIFGFIGVLLAVPISVILTMTFDGDEKSGE
jgi:predicted PurR-regulated permease PerM